MSLQFALLLVGVLIVISVAVGALDQVRINRRRGRRAERGSIQNHSEKSEETKEPIDASIDTPPHKGATPATALEKKALKADIPILSRQPSPDDKAFYDELESYEQAAELRLDIDPEIDHRVADSADNYQTEIGYRAMADEKIDFVITLPARKPISRRKALGLFKQNEYMLEKPRGIFGLRRFTGVWSNLETDPELTEYNDLRLSLQMVNSEGPVDESELNTFVQMGLLFADTLRRRTEFSLDFEDALEYAKDLDAFGKEHDVIASVNVIANNAAGFSGHFLERIIDELGLEFGAMNIFHRISNDGRCLFSMANLYQPGEFNPKEFETFTTKGVTLFMQIPCVYDPDNEFIEMVQVAQQLANRLDGQVVDQDMKPLTEAGIVAIQSQIEPIITDMRVRGIQPGGETALRLFNR